MRHQPKHHLPPGFIPRAALGYPLSPAVKVLASDALGFLFVPHFFMLGPVPSWVVHSDSSLPTLCQVPRHEPPPKRQICSDPRTPSWRNHASWQSQTYWGKQDKFLPVPGIDDRRWPCVNHRWGQRWFLRLIWEARWRSKLMVAGCLVSMCLNEK